MGKNRRHVFASPLVILLAFVTAGVAQECKSKLCGELILGEDNRISRVNPETGIKTAYASSPRARGLAYDLNRGVLYWSDMDFRRIYGLNEGDEIGDVYLSRQRWLPCGIAHEPVTDKIYIAEGFSDSVFAFDLRRNKQAVVLSLNLIGVKAVVVDAFEGYLFLVDKYQIVRADLDGKNRKVLLEEVGNLAEDLDTALDSLKKYFKKSKRMDLVTYKKDLSIADIAIDTNAKRLYWVNVNARNIESFDYDGQDRRVHFQDKSEPAAFDDTQTYLKIYYSKIALLGDSIYWADKATEKIFKVDLNGGGSRVLLENVESVSLKGVDCSRYRSAPNPCASNNCEHLCLLSRSSEDKVSCACQIGYRLGQDGKSCQLVKDFVIFVKNDFLHGLSLDGFASVIDPSPYQVGANAILDFDAAENVAYYNSRYPHDKLHRLHLNSGKSEILTPDILSQSVRDIAFDWTTKNLYYLSYYFADVTTLNVLNTRDPTYSRIVLENAPRMVRGIALHPNKGHLYIAQLDDDDWSGKISRVNTDGSNLKVVVKMDNIQTLNGLTIDYDEDRVYWSEAKKISENEYEYKWATRVRHSNLDGQDIQDISLPSGLEVPSDLAVFGDSIYTISGPEGSLLRLNKSNPREFELLIKGELSGLKVFSGVTQRTAAGHPCAGDHGCAKFCFAVPSIHGLKATCGCPYGEKLAADGKRCEDNSAAEPPFKPCQFSFKCNKQTE